MSTLEILAIAAVLLLVYLVGTHKIDFAALKTKMEGFEKQLGLVHQAAMAPVLVAPAPTAPVAAAPAPAPIPGVPDTAPAAANTGGTATFPGYGTAPGSSATPPVGPSNPNLTPTRPWNMWLGDVFGRGMPIPAQGTIMSDPFTVPDGFSGDVQTHCGDGVEFGTAKVSFIDASGATVYGPSGDTAGWWRNVAPGVYRARLENMTDTPGVFATVMITH